jgi:hypothetical protein
VWVCRLKSSLQKVLVRNKFGFWDLASPDAIAQLEDTAVQAAQDSA